MKLLKGTADVVAIIESQEGGAILFTTPNCATCETVKAKLDSAGIEIPVFVIEGGNDIYPVPQFNISHVPTIISFKDGEEVARVRGVQHTLTYEKIAIANKMSDEVLEEFTSDLLGTDIIVVDVKDLDVVAEEVSAITLETIKENIERYNDTFDEATNGIYNHSNVEELQSPEYKKAFDENYLNPMAEWILGLITSK